MWTSQKAVAKVIEPFQMSTFIHKVKCTLTLTFAMHARTTSDHPSEQDHPYISMLVEILL